MMSINTDDVPSPCVRNCCLNTDDVCLGCFRTVSEIVAWGQADSNKRKSILRIAEQRKQKADKANRII